MQRLVHLLLLDIIWFLKSRRPKVCSFIHQIFISHVWFIQHPSSIIQASSPRSARARRFGFIIFIYIKKGTSKLINNWNRSRCDSCYRIELCHCVVCRTLAGVGEDIGRILCEEIIAPGGDGGTTGRKKTKI